MLMPMTTTGQPIMTTDGSLGRTSLEEEPLPGLGVLVAVYTPVKAAEEVPSECVLPVLGRPGVPTTTLLVGNDTDPASWKKMPFATTPFPASMAFVSSSVHDAFQLRTQQILEGVEDGVLLVWVALAGPVEL